MPKNYTYGQLIVKNHAELDEIITGLKMEKIEETKAVKVKAILRKLEEAEFGITDSKPDEIIPEPVIEEKTKPTISKKETVAEIIPEVNGKEIYGKIILKAFVKDGDFEVLGEIIITQAMADRFFMPAIVKTEFHKV